MWSCKCGKVEVSKINDVLKVFVCPSCHSKLSDVNEQTKLNSFNEVKSDIDDLNEKYKMIIEAYKVNGDMTDRELTKFLDLSDPNIIRPRRFELVNDYKDVIHKSTRECNVTGKTCKVWGL